MPVWVPEMKITGNNPINNLKKNKKTNVRGEER
jgi:hypothetical protein